MVLPRWDDEMKFELLRLKSELRPENFRALHQPLGLGVRTESQDAKGAQAPFPHLSPLAAPSPQSNSQPMPKTLQEAIGPLPSLGKAPSSWFRNLLRGALVHALDLAFVCLCLSLGLILLSWVIDPQHVSTNVETLKQASPLQFLQKLQTLALIVGIYTAFVLYWIFFKVVSGTTLGETCFDLMKHQENTGSAVQANGSGDS